MKDIRLIVAQALLKTESRDAWSNLSLDSALRFHQLGSSDSAFAGALFYGVIERRITLDACIAVHSKQPPDKLSPQVLTALRIGVYQLLYMDGVPDHAAVSQSVELVKKLRKTQAAGYVNGVLRAFLRADKQIPLPTDTIRRLSVMYSCPEELVTLWADAYGEERTEGFLRDSLGRPPVAVRVNTLKTTPDKLIALLAEEKVSASAHPQLEHCLLLEQTGAVQQLLAFRQGLMHVQDVSSQLCAAALDARPGHRVLDACAAPGGKTFTLMELMEGNGEIIACDLHEKRVGLIERRAAELGIPGIEGRCLNMTKPQEGLGEFDRVLCDVPCSGYGVIRRKPEIKYKSLSQFTYIPKTQYKILENSSHYCKAGGVLLYSTCTLTLRENQEVTELFLQNNPAFAPRPLGGLLGDAPSRTLMGEFGADGFYIAAFTKE